MCLYLGSFAQIWTHMVRYRHDGYMWPCRRYKLLALRTSMQPLSYQMLSSSCWVTSMINGMLLLYRDKNRIPPLAYRLVHSVLTDDGVHDSGPVRNDWKIVLDAIQQRTGFQIDTYQGRDVASALEALTFKKQVAICDIGSGSHSILLTGRDGEWIEAFDPDWDNVKKSNGLSQHFITMPTAGSKRANAVNVKIKSCHLTKSGKGRIAKFQMGAVASRTLTVLSNER